MLVKSLYKDVAKDLGISKERVQMLYSAYWNCIKEGLKALDIRDNMGIEDFAGNRYGYYVAKIGRLYCDYRTYKAKNRRLNELKERKNAENNKSETDVQ